MTLPEGAPTNPVLAQAAIDAIQAAAAAADRHAILLVLEPGGLVRHYHATLDPERLALSLEAMVLWLAAHPALVRCIAGACGHAPGTCSDPYPRREM